jgi:hypothetical protein
MFKKRKWIIISILAAAIVVAVGVMGGAAYAKSNTAAAAAPTNPQKVLAEKVAAILGLDAAKVEAAITQAQKEINTERAAERLAAEEARIDQMVKDGKLTEDQAAKLKAWLESKPDVAMPNFDGNGGFGPGNCGPRGPGWQRGFNRGFGPGFDPDSTAIPTPTTTN